jgi:hypothetical protein
MRCAGLLDDGARLATVHLVDCQPVGDRLAVWTYVEAGEEIPCGDPSVTDAERSAAGQETLAQRWRVLPEPNRRHAAMPDLKLDAVDAAELAELLQFLAGWRARDPDRLGASLGDYVGHPAYNIGELR